MSKRTNGGERIFNKWLKELMDMYTLRKRSSRRSISAPSSRTLLFEALEPRILLSADPFGSTALVSSPQLAAMLTQNGSQGPAVDVFSSANLSFLDSASTQSSLPGSLIHRETISAPADGSNPVSIDMDLTGNQAFTFGYESADPDFRGTVELLDPDGNQILFIDSPDSAAYFTTTGGHTTSDGHYTLLVTPTAGTGGFDAEITFNANDEREPFGAYYDNDTLENAEDLGWTSVDLGDGSSRLGAVGKTSDSSDQGLVDTDMYKFTAGAGQILDIALSYAVSGSGGLPPQLEILDASGRQMAFGVGDGSSGGFAAVGPSGSLSREQLRVSRLLVNESQTFYVRISGDMQSDYALVIGRDAVVNLDPEADMALAGNSKALGGLSETSVAPIQVGVLYSDYNQVYRLINQLQDYSVQRFSVNSIYIGYEGALSSLSDIANYDAIVIGGVPEAWLSGAAPVLKAWQEAGGGLIMTGPASGGAVADIDSVIPADLGGGTSTHFDGTVEIIASHPVVSGVGNFVSGTSEIAASDAEGTVLATINGEPAVIVSNVGLGRNVYLAPDYLVNTSSDGLQYGNADRLLEQAVAWAARHHDTYYYEASEGDAITISLSSINPQVSDPLSVQFSVYDPYGDLIATFPGDDALSFTATISGSHRIEVSRIAGSGEYLLDVSGSSTPTYSALFVNNTDFWWHSEPPTTIMVELNAPVLFTSLDVSDFLIDGHPVAGISFVDARTIVLDASNVVTGDGEYTFTIVDGSFTALDGTPVSGYEATRYFDGTPPIFTSSSISNGDVLPASEDPITFELTVSEPGFIYGSPSYYAALTNLVTNETVNLLDYSYNYDTNTITLNFGPLHEGQWTLSVSGIVFADNYNNITDADQDGSPGGYFVRTFSVDAAPRIPLDFVAVGPSGGLVQAVSHDGYFDADADADDFTVDLEAGQDIALSLICASSSVRLELFDATNTSLGFVTAAAGERAVLQRTTASAGTYRIVATSTSGNGEFTLVSVLNALDEGTGENGTIATAVSLNPSAVTVGATRFAAYGMIASASDADMYALTLGAGQTLDIVIRSATGSATLDLAIVNASGTVVAAGIQSAGSVAIDNFTASAAGTYYLRVTGDEGADYVLAAVRGGQLDQPAVREQIIGNGYLFGRTGGGAGGAIRVAVHHGAYGADDVVAQLNDDSYFNFSAEQVLGSQIDTFAELANYDVVILGDEYYRGEYASFAGALRQFVEAGGGVVATGWTVFNAGSAGNSPVADINAILPVDTATYYNYYYGNVTLESANHPILDGIGGQTAVINNYIEFAPVDDPNATVLARVGGTAVAAAGEYRNGRGVYLGPTYAGRGGSSMASGVADRFFEQAVAWAARARNTYTVELAAGQTLTVSTTTPGDAAGAPINALDPSIVLSDASGNVLAQDDNSAADGRNVLLTYTATSAGTYRITVGGVGQGDFVLHVDGVSTPAITELSVVSTTPVDGDLLAGQVPIVTVNFSTAINLSSLSASDFTITRPNGSTAQASGFTVIDGDTLAFSLAGALTDEGTYTFALASGALSSVQGATLQAYSATFVLDNTAPSVIAVSPTGDSNGPLDFVTFTFNEALDPSSINIGNVVEFTNSLGTDLRSYLSGYDVNGSTVRIYFSRQNVAGAYHLKLSGDIKDLAGNRMGTDYDATFNLQLPDITITNATAPLTGTVGSNVVVSWDGASTGPGAAWTYWYDRVILSSTADPSGYVATLGDTYIWEGSGQTDRTYSRSVSMQVPNIAEGTYYVIVMGDGYNYQAERNENNNFGVAGQITIGKSNLTASNVVAPTSASPGETVSISFDIINSGAALTNAQFYNYVYLSDSPNLASGNNTVVASYWQYSDIGQNQTLPQTIDITIPSWWTGTSGYIVVAVDAGNYIGETNENDNRASSDIVTLSEADLAIDPVLSVPASADVGQTISIGWTVTNNSTENVSGGWHDYVYLSADDVLDSNDIYLTNVYSSDVSPVLAGQGYTRNANVQIPASFTGTQGYLIVVTDRNGSIRETDETNNTAVKAITINRSDLVVTDLKLRTANEVVAGGSLFRYIDQSLSWEAAKLAAEALGGHLATFGTAGEYEAVQSAFRQYGDWWIGLSDTETEGAFKWVTGEALSYTGWANGQPDDAGSNEDYVSGNWGNPGWNDYPSWYNFGYVVEFDNYADTANAIGGQRTRIELTAANQGAGSTNYPYIYDRFYISSDAVLDNSDIALNSYALGTSGGLLSGGTYSNAVYVTMPENLADGTYYLIARTDYFGEISESNEDNNTLALAFNLRSANLQVTDLTAPDAAATGQQITVEWTTQNTGSARADGNWYDRVYFSADAVFDGSDTYLGDYWAGNYSPLAAGASYGVPASLTVSIPGGVSDGTYYLIVVSDIYDYQSESNESDNWRAREITVSNADLLVTSVRAPASAVLNEYLDIDYTVANQGTGDASRGWYDRVWFSTDAVLDAGDRYIGERYRGSSVLGAGANYDGTISVRMPSDVADGTYYLIVETDNYRGQPESNEGNNTYAKAIAVTSPDLVVSSVTGSTTGVSGQQATVNWTVRNEGTGQAVADWYDYVYLSTDGVLDGSDTILSWSWTGGHTPLATNGIYDASATVTLPAGLADGDYYFIVVTDRDNYQGEYNTTGNAEQNNAASMKITVSNVNLIVSAIDAPSKATPGAATTVTWTGKNSGTGTANGDWWDIVYLSADGTLDGADIAVGSFNASAVSPLAANATYQGSAQLDLPSGLADGTYHLFVRTDAYGYQAESSNDDNTLGVTIEIRSGNLVVSSISGPAGGIAGQPISFTYTVANTGTGSAAAGQWYDYAYLSTDTVLDNSDIGLGLIDITDEAPLAAGASYSKTVSNLTIPSYVGNGTYYLILRSDIYDYQRESSNDDNTRGSSAFAIGVPDLQVDTVSGIPANASFGDHLEISWTASNHGTAAAVSNWYDSIYLSTDGTLDGSDQRLNYKLVSQNPLAANVGYTSSMGIDLPLTNGLSSGQWYLIVVTDDFDYVSEPGSNANNAKAIALSLAYPSLPDLTVANLSAATPDGAVSGGRVNIAWDTQNSGNAPVSGSFYQRITVTNQVTGATVLDQLTYRNGAASGAIGAGSSATNALEFRLPDGAQGVGTFTVSVTTDYYSQVFERNLAGTAESNNTAQTNLVTTLASYGDLVASNVSVLPANPVSGDLLTINWQTANQGNKTVGAFSERLEIINQTTGAVLRDLWIPYDPASAAEGSLDAGESAARSTTFRLPDGAAGVGAILVRVTTDIGNSIYELNGVGNAETNNSASTTVTSTLAAYPDLTITAVTAPAAANAGAQANISWVVTNSGTKSITASWTEQVFLSDDGALGGGSYIGSVYFDNVTIAAGQSVTHSGLFTIPSYAEGGRRVVVTTDTYNQVVELSEANNSAIDDQQIQLNSALSFSLNTRSVAETAGTAAAVGTVSRSGNTNEALTVSLSSASAGVTLPATVTIPAGQASVTFNLGVLNNALVDGSRNAVLTASANGYGNGSATLTVTDDDTPRLTVTTPVTIVMEDDGTIVGTVTRNTPTDVALVVSLQVDKAYKAQVPSSVTIAAGQSSATFNIVLNNDNFVEGARDIRINASASGITSGSKELTVNDDDVPVLTMSLAESVVSEAAGLNATYLTITRSVVTDQAIEILLRGDPNQIRVPHSVIIGANQSSATVPVAVNNNSAADGSRLVLMTADVADYVLRLPIPGTTANTTLQILDNDGPTLTVTIDKDTVAEGAGANAAIGTVTRNTDTSQALTVTLMSSDTSEAVVPATVVIPAGQASATFMIGAVQDNQTDGTQTASIIAQADGFNAGATGLQVTDRDLADLVISNISVPAGLKTNNSGQLSWSVANTGLGAVPGNYVTRVYLSTDVVLSSDDTLITTADGTPLGVGQTSQSFTANFTVPGVAGAYYAIVVTDPLGAIQELSEANNIRVAEFNINPSYRATVVADIEQAPSGTTIPLHGTAYDADTGQAAAFKPVKIQIGKDGTKRDILVYTNAHGEFQAVFKPLSGETGHFTISADHPGVQNQTAQDEFVLLGMRANQTSVNVQIVPNDTVTGQITLTNLTDVNLTGLTAVVEGLPPGVAEVTLSVPSTLVGDGSVVLSYSIKAITPEQVRGQINFALTTNQNVDLNIGATIQLSPLRPNLVTTTGSIETGMLVGSQKLVTFEIQNNGGAPTGPLTVLLPNEPWLTLASSANIASLAAGEKATVTLRLNPGADLPLVRYDGSIVVAGANSSVTVGYRILAVSEAVGDVKVDVEDEYTYFAEGAPKLAGARVTLTNPYTYEVVATGFTGADGSINFTGVRKGVYTLDISAEKHDAVRTSFTVEEGKLNETTAFMHRQAVSYNWTVVPTEVNDRYKIVLESTFETEVPMPVVTVDQPLVVPLVLPGQTTQFNLTYRNHGLIDALDVQINVPKDPDFEIIPLVDHIDRLPAMSEVTVPFLIRAKADSALAAAAIKAASLDSMSVESIYAGNTADGLIRQEGWGGTIAKCLGINSVYTYECRNNQWVAVNTSLDPIFCAEDLAGAGASLAENMGNLVEAGCDVLGAILQCFGADDCVQAMISAACGGIVGGLTAGPGGAAAGVAGALDDILGCLCSLFGPISIGDVSSSNPGGGGGYGGWGGYGGFSAPWSAPVGYTLPPLCGDTGPSSASTGELTSLDTSGVCAEVRLQIEQEAVITRTGFLGTLELINGQTDAELSDVKLTLDFRDQNGNSASDKFVIRSPGVYGFTEQGGTYTLAPDSTGKFTYTFIPTVDAAVNGSERYEIGGVLEYTSNGQKFHINLVPGQITVYPEAQLSLDYFWQRDVYADDPFTDQIEPSEPFVLGLQVHNEGKGAAKNLTITSAQPEIVENEKGLLIDFSIISSQINGNAATPSLTIDLGMIMPGAVTTGQWNMVSSLQGKFKEFSATFTHEDDGGDLRTSLIKSVNIHELIRQVEIGFDSDIIPDYLVNDIADSDNLADTLYLSNGSQAPVFAVTEAVIGGSGATRTLTAQAANGWTYFKVPEPVPGMKLLSVTRSDGVIVPIGGMAWQTDRSFPADRPGVVYENLLHILDYNSTGIYTLNYVNDDNTAPTVVSVTGASGVIDTVPTSLDIAFSEALTEGSFTLGDIEVKRDGTVLDLTGATMTLLGGNTYRLGGLAGILNIDGNYSVTVDASGVTDLLGNVGSGSASTTFALSAEHMVAVSIENVQPDPRNQSVSTLDVVFSRTVDASTFNTDDISLKLNGTDIALDGVTIVRISDTTYRIAGLADLTTGDGLFELTVRTSGISDNGGIAGAGAITESWTGDHIGPGFMSIQEINTNPRNTVVRQLDVVFNEAIDGSTFDWHDVRLTRNGGVNLITNEVTVTHVEGSVWRIANFNWKVGLEGLYQLTVDGSGIRDLAGNVGSGSVSRSWTMDITNPGMATNVLIGPDNGPSSTDGRTNTGALTITGDLPQTGLRVRLTDITNGIELGLATVAGQTFAHAFNIASPGKHEIRIRVADEAGNVAEDVSVTVFIDQTAPYVASITDVTPDLRTTPVDSVDVTVSEKLDDTTVGLEAIVLARDGVAITLDNSVTIEKVSDKVYRISGLSAWTSLEGAYTLTVAGSGLSDLAGNAGTGSKSEGWTMVGSLPTGFGGYVFNDYDGDGLRDVGASVPAWETQEMPLAGWTVFIDTNLNGILDAGETSTTSDDTGAYRFVNVAPGSYRVVAEVRDGWYAAVPLSLHYDINVAADEYKTASFNFGRFQYGEVSGIKFNDLDADGILDDGEAGIAGETVFLDVNGNGILDAGEQYQQTGADGSYHFTQVKAAPSMKLGMVDVDGWQRTSPAAAFQMVSNLNRSGLNVGVTQLVTLSGTKFEDLNGNGTREDGEAGLAGWTIFIDANNDGVLQSTERSTQTDDQGRFWFASLLPGTYIIAEVQRDGWVQTSPLTQGGSDILGTAGSEVTITVEGCHCGGSWVMPGADGVDFGSLSLTMAENVTKLTQARQDLRFSNLDGTGMVTVVIDTGIDTDHAFFGPDSDGDGVADRIIFQYDFANGDADASDADGHGSHIASLIASSDGTYTGIAKGADLIVLKVFEDGGRGTFRYVEQALQWVIANAANYNIGVINMSLGDSGNWTDSLPRYGLGDEFATLSGMDIITIAAAGNHYSQYNALGVSYPASDPAVISVGSTWSGDFGGPWKVATGGIDYSTGADRIASYSQRDANLIDTFAPGSRFNGANADGGMQTMQGTSQAAAFVSGAATLVQQLAQQVLGYKLSTGDFAAMLRHTGDKIFDGDDEDDNVKNSGQTYPRINFENLFNAVLNFKGTGSQPSNGEGGGGNGPVYTSQTASPGVHQVTAVAGQTVDGLDFGNFKLGSISGQLVRDANASGTVNVGEDAIVGQTVFLDANSNGIHDADEASQVTGLDGSFNFTGVGPGSFTIGHLLPIGWTDTGAIGGTISMTSGLAATATLLANNPAPVTGTDSYSTAADTPLRVSVPGVLTNDSDSFGDDFALALEQGPAHGNLVLNADGSFTYIPAAGYGGQDGFAYRLTDTAGNVTIGNVTITVDLHANHAPEAGNDSYSTAVGTALSVAAPGVLSNDSDAEGDSLSVTLETGAAHGVLGLNADGSFTYTPSAGYAGADSFIYRVTDTAGNSALGTVSLTVRADATKPVANPDKAEIALSDPSGLVAGNLLANDSAGSGNALYLRALNGTRVGNKGVTTIAGTYGTFQASENGAFTYVLDKINPAVQNLPAGSKLVESVTYKIANNGGGSDSDKLTITILGAPVPNRAPAGTNDSYATGFETALSVIKNLGVLSNDTDADGDTLAAILVAGPEHGTLTLLSDGAFTYTPEAGYSGMDSFRYKASDASADSATVTVSILIRLPAATQPVAHIDTAEISVNDVAGKVTGNVLTNDTPSASGKLYLRALNAGKVDPKGAMTVIAGKYGTFSASVDGTFVYTLDKSNAAVMALQAGQTLTEKASYKFTDGAGFTDTDLLVITIRGPEAAPASAEIFSLSAPASFHHSGVPSYRIDAATTQFVAVPDYVETPVLQFASLPAGSSSRSHAQPEDVSEAPGAKATVNGGLADAFASNGDETVPVTDNADRVAVLAEVNGNASEKPDQVVIDLASMFKDFGINDDNSMMKYDWQTTLLDELASARMASANKALRISLPDVA